MRELEDNLISIVSLPHQNLVIEKNLYYFCLLVHKDMHWWGC